METKTDNASTVSGEPFVRCTVLMPHVRNIDGKTLMFEPLFSGIVMVPNDDDTKRAIEAGWLKVVSSK